VTNERIVSNDIPFFREPQCTRWRKINFLPEMWSISLLTTMMYMTFCYT